MLLDINSQQAQELYLMMEEFEKQISDHLGKQVKIKITEYTNGIERDIFNENKTAEGVFKAIENICGISKQQLQSNSRERKIADIRFIGFHIIKETCPLITLKSIGKYFGGKDHTTVLHGLSKFTIYYQNEPEFREKHTLILNELNKQST